MDSLAMSDCRWNGESHSEYSILSICSSNSSIFDGIDIWLSCRWWIVGFNVPAYQWRNWNLISRRLRYTYHLLWVRIRLTHIIWGFKLNFRVNSLITITIFTPNTIPSDGIHLIKESVFLNLFCKKKQSLGEDLSEEPEKNEASEEKSSEEPAGSMLDIFKNKNIWLLLLASCAWELRRNTHQGWLAAGWPQWVAAGDDNIADGDQFDYDINRFQSIAFFCLIGGNLIPGILIDTMNKRITRFVILGSGRFLWGWNQGANRTQAVDEVKACVPSRVRFARTYRLGRTRTFITFEFSGQMTQIMAARWRLWYYHALTHYPSRHKVFFKPFQMKFVPMLVLYFIPLVGCQVFISIPCTLSYSHRDTTD